MRTNTDQLRAVPSRALVVGFARTGRAVARALGARGCVVTACDDRPGTDAADIAEQMGIWLLAAPDDTTLANAVRRVDLVVVSPGVAPVHPVFDLAKEVSLISEIELAYRLARRPIIAVTGTNGKTTVTELVAAMLNSSGLRARAVGNIGVPLIEAIEESDIDLLVCETSSFQLAYTEQFAPATGTWLNFAEDHLDWHRTTAEYASAKSKIWAHQQASDVAVANASDPFVMDVARGCVARVVTFGPDHGDFCVRQGRFVGPGDGDFGPIAGLSRQLPHDLANATAAIATAVESGATSEGCASALKGWQVPPHRVEFVGEMASVRYFDDSKATTPAATIAALSGFSSVILIAGGRNKGLQLSVLRQFADRSDGPQLRAVIAIGEAAPEIEMAFTPGYHVERAVSMDDAVDRATALAEAGDAVLLSPACASFDWYGSYEERGEDFARSVGRLAVRRPSGRGGP